MPRSTSNTLPEHLAFARLAAMGVDSVRVDFSGGNDEGGVDGMTAFMADGTVDNSFLRDAQAHEVYSHTWTDQQGVTTRSCHFRGADGNAFADGVWVVLDSGGVWGGGKYVEPTYRVATAEEKELSRLSHALGAPVYQRYGSFAGEFEVSGSITWDVKARSVNASGYERSYTYEEF
jgi:hypothetical protein